MAAGLLDADGALLSTDYRAAERLYATLAQVAGRSLELRLSSTPLRLRFVAGSEGVISGIDLRYTVLEVNETTRVLVPNSTLFTNSITVVPSAPTACWSR